MKRFTLNQRVLVEAVDHSHGELHFRPPRPGTVVRLRRTDDGAWVALDKREIAFGIHPFPADDPRATHVLTFPEFFEPEKGSLR